MPEANEIAAELGVDAFVQAMGIKHDPNATVSVYLGDHLYIVIRDQVGGPDLIVLRVNDGALDTVIEGDEIDRVTEAVASNELN